MRKAGCRENRSLPKLRMTQINFSYSAKRGGEGGEKTKGQERKDQE